MAITLVGTPVHVSVGTDDNTPTIVAVYGTAAQVGDVYVFDVGWGSSTSENPSSAADTGSTSTWTVVTAASVRDSTDAQSRSSVVGKVTSAGTGTVTVTLPGNRNNKSGTLSLWRGCDVSGTIPLTATGQSQLSTAAPSSGNVTPAAGAVVISSTQDVSFGLATITPEGSATVLSNTGGADGCCSQYEIAASSSPIAGDFTSSGAPSSGVRSYITTAVVLAAASSGTTVTSTETGTLTDRVTGIALDGPKDSGSATERNTIAADLTPPRDTGSMGEGVPGIALALTDTGTLSETSSINTGSSITSSDTGTLADDVLDIQIDDGPEGTLTERVSGIALDGPRDTGTASEGNSIAATLTSTDTATLGESSSITQTGTNPTDSQTISFSESGQVTVTVISADTGTAADTPGTLAADVAGSDGQAMADAIAALLASLSSAESAQLLEAATVTPSGSSVVTGVLSGRVTITPRMTGGISISGGG